MKQALNQSIQQVREWLLSREPRERILILICGALLALFLLHAMIWSPLLNGYESTKSQLHKLRQDVVWMRSAAKVLLTNKRHQPLKTSTSQGSLPTIVDQSARSSGMINVIKRVEPRKDKVQVILQHANFGKLLQWIEILHQRHKLSITQISINRTKQAGFVNVRVVLSRLSQ
ncbi:hypothetical protein MNBD_GAMMA12-3361 [hydrothermal vent metagenome]|uniref:General secretion pathway protein M n=1 Tax=hydrothermal vent metagenome TaxID=652676 RepID=A0A3B0XYH1_9ZZZZ